MNTIPLEYVDETLEFNPEWIVDKIAPEAHLLRPGIKRKRRQKAAVSTPRSSA